MNLRSLEQKRADFAYKKVLDVKKPWKIKVKENSKEVVKDIHRDIERKYSSYVKKAPVLILTNGLGQTLAFYLSKLDEPLPLTDNGSIDYPYRTITNKIENREDPEADKYKKAEAAAYAYLYAHISEWLMNNFTNGKDPLRYYMEATGMEAIVLTDETIAFLNWLKRFAEAMLEKEENGE